jgi:hypothetical protein
MSQLSLETRGSNPSLGDVFVFVFELILASGSLLKVFEQLN